MLMHSKDIHAGVLLPSPQCFNTVIYTVLKWKHNALSPGGRLNKKDGLTRYGNSHVKDKTS